LEIDWLVKLIILVIFLAASAFFSGSEVALFSLDKRKIKKQFKSHSLKLKYIDSLIETPRRLLVTILIGNTVFNVAASIVAVTIAIEVAPLTGISEELAITIQIILLTMLILLFGELLPKVIASSNPVSFARVTVIPIYWVGVIVYPFAETITELIKFTKSKVVSEKTTTVLSKDEITDLTEIGQEQGTLEEEEHELIKSIVSFKEIIAGEIMTPRVDIKAFSSDTDFKKVVDTINTTGHSRFPLYQEDLDQIKGILYAKDILPFLNDSKNHKPSDLSNIARKPMFVPKTKKINDLLREFQSQKIHIAVVVDEYGGTAGLITLEDIIEEVVGEIWDEYDKKEDAIKVVDENKFIVLGKTSIDEVNETIGDEIISEESDFETVGGLVFKNAGSIPKEGYNFTIDNYKFTVKEVYRKRVKKVLIEKEIIV
jgi:gliding motility-associated protein GldE